MKNYDKLIVLSFVVYVVMAVAAVFAVRAHQGEKGQFYKVEINRILAQIEAAVTENTAGRQAEAISCGQAEEVEGMQTGIGGTDVSQISVLFTGCRI